LALVLLIDKHAVSAVLEMPALIEAVEGALVQVSQGTARNPNRLRVFVAERQAMLACMPAYLAEGDGLLGARIVASCSKPVPPGEPRLLASVVALANTEGRFLALMPGSDLGPLRTAAASAVAIRHLARADAATMAIIGCGVQGRAELAASVLVRKLDKVWAYDIDAGVARRFATEMGATLGITVSVAASAEEAVAFADIVTTATTAIEPVVACSAIRPGTHINAVGAHTPQTRELGSDVVSRARVFAETREALFGEAGDVLIPLEEGRFDQAHVLGEIGEVVSDRVAGRLSPEDVTVFKSTGIAVEDVIAAKLVYERALARGIGTRIDF
jgi:ornithine cyclodeaminase/alanine dehydrogenase-like protein (mu-crystallin family)